MPKLLHHLMASRIQQRFWYARGRWNTTRRIGKRLLRAGLDLQKPSDLIKALNSDHVMQQFTLWFRRLLPKRIAAPCMRSVLNAFGICAFKYECADRTYADSDHLIELAEAVAQSMDANLRAPAASFDPAALEQMEEYLVVYCVWLSANDTDVREALLQTAVSRALQLITRRTERGANAEHDRFAKLSLFFDGMNAVAHFIQSSREVQLVSGLKHSLFWGPGDTSVFRLLHEILMDERFILSRDTVCVKFQAHYQKIPPSKVGKFLQDLRAVLLFPLQDPPVITEMVRALDLDPAYSDLSAFADRLMPLIARAVPNPAISQQLSTEWQTCDRETPHCVLDALREAAVSLRYAFALEELEQCKRNVWRHRDGFQHTQADVLVSQSTHTKHTERWIARILQRGHPQLERLAAGDSFALLRFHDHEIVRFVLEGQFDAPLLAPEVLQFDIDRMRGIMCDGYPAEQILEMVDTHEVPDSLPQYLKDSVASLRRIVFVCRFQHGDSIAEITQRVAKRILSERMAQ